MLGQPRHAALERMTVEVAKTRHACAVTFIAGLRVRVGLHRRDQAAAEGDAHPL